MLAICSFALISMSTDNARLHMHCMLDWLNMGSDVSSFSNWLTAYVIFYPVGNFFIFMWMTYENICRERVCA